MLHWARLLGDQYLGLWAPGILLFALQEVPYLLMPLFHLQSNPIMNMPETSPTLDLLEKALGVACIVLMVFVVRGDAMLFSASDTWEKACLALVALTLAANYLGWGLYFTGHQSRLVMMLFLVAMPPLYYAAIGL
ncbi:MAG: hypothetical protein DUD33_08460 [Coriobacteriaceae bacterium]|nr:MAG: hypothetical protein DUD33_08460 [Coriobacteriaceae bacterium]